MKKAKYVGHLCQNTGFNKPYPTRKTGLFLLLLKRKDNLMIRRVLPEVHQRFCEDGQTSNQYNGGWKEVDEPSVFYDLGLSRTRIEPRSPAHEMDVYHFATEAVTDFQKLNITENAAKYFSEIKSTWLLFINSIVFSL